MSQVLQTSSSINFYKPLLSYFLNLGNSGQVSLTWRSKKQKSVRKETTSLHKMCHMVLVAYIDLDKPKHHLSLIRDGELLNKYPQFTNFSKIIMASVDTKYEWK